MENGKNNNDYCNNAVYSFDLFVVYKYQNVSNS